MIDKRIATTLVSGPGAALAGFASMAPPLPHVLMTAGSAVLISAASYFSLAPDAVVAAAPSVDPQAAAALLLLLAFLAALAQVWPEGGFSAGVTASEPVLPLVEAVVGLPRGRPH